MPLDRAALEKILHTPRDNAMLRVSLASACQAEGQIQKALGYLQSAVEKDPNYSAAWKQLGKLAAENNNMATARDAFINGIRVAQDKGDLQAVREMQVFLRRLPTDESLKA